MPNLTPDLIGRTVIVMRDEVEVPCRVLSYDEHSKVFFLFDTWAKRRFKALTCTYICSNESKIARAFKAGIIKKTPKVVSTKASTKTPLALALQQLKSYSPEEQKQILEKIRTLNNGK